MQIQQQTQSTRLGELLSEGDYDYSSPRANAVREATILQKSASDLIVDIGAKRDAVVPPRDLQRVPQERIDELRVGDVVPVVVMRRGVATNDLIPVSFSQGLQQEDWLRAKEMVDTGEVVECEVMESNRGGVVVRFGRIRGFVPNSHLGSLPGGRRGDLNEIKEDLIGTVMPLAVIDVNPQRRRLVLSRRAADRKRRKELLHELEPGQVHKGIVQNIVDFGAFVDIGGIDGLVHISELAWEHVDHPSDVLSLGEEVEVTVLNVDVDRQRVGLSRKRLLPDPWEEVTSSLAIGDNIVGHVTHIVDFGLFVDVGQGVEGLVHETQVPKNEDGQPMYVAVDDRVEVQILFIDDDKHQLSLSLLRVLLPEDAEAVQDADSAVDQAAESSDSDDAVLDEGVLLY